MFIRRYLDDIRKNMKGMSSKEKVSYVITYYWYHILIIVSIIALIFFTVRFYVFQNKKPEFTCVIADQTTDEERDKLIMDTFAQKTGLDPEWIVVDSDYLFSYGDFSNTLIEKITGKTGEKLLLAFPDNGKHENLCNSFLECIAEIKSEIGG